VSRPGATSYETPEKITMAGAYRRIMESVNLASGGYVAARAGTPDEPRPQSGRRLHRAGECNVFTT
jgi:hypothetical protein